MSTKARSGLIIPFVGVNLYVAIPSSLGMLEMTELEITTKLNLHQTADISLHQYADWFC